MPRSARLALASAWRARARDAGTAHARYSEYLFDMCVTHSQMQLSEIVFRVSVSRDAAPVYIMWVCVR